MPRNPNKTCCSVPGCRAWAIHGSDPPLCSPHSGRAGAPAENQNHLVHGFYATTLQPDEAADVAAYPVDDTLEPEIAVTRVALRRIHKTEPQIFFPMPTGIPPPPNPGSPISRSPSNLPLATSPSLVYNTPGGAMGQRVQADLLRWLMPAILLAYLVMGGLYAVYTPDWQAPDEPAHYNYVAYLAAQQRFPVLKPGDYPAAYLEEIKAAHFPDGMSIAPIRYEFHQPPLYYLLAVPVYRLFGGALLPLRLLSVLMGALLLLVVYWIVQEVVPARPFLALGAMAFVAFLPMHLTFAAAVNNDTLAELLLALVLLFTVRYCRSASFPSPASDRRLLVLMGIATGLGLVTKSTAYIALPLVLAAILARHVWIERAGSAIPAYGGEAVEIRPAHGGRGSSAGLVRSAAAYALPAVVLGIPWWLRNVAVYGGLDWMGLGRHDLVVAGQLRTADFIAQNGTGRLVRDFVVTSFHSFWGQFGWMGVLLDQRIYQALAILTALAAAGFVLWAVAAWRRRARVPRWQAAAGGLLALSGLLTLASYLWYNTQFLQHQGRYLFPALVPISLAVALGWREALRRERALLLAALLVAGAASLWLLGALSAWLLLMIGAAAAAFLVRRFLPAGWDPFVHALPYALLVPLDLACLFLFIVPQLAA